MSKTALEKLLLEGSDCNAIADMLDHQDHQGRMNLLIGLSRSALGRLHRLAAQSEPLDIEFFVGDAEPQKPVVHHGWNSVPVPRPWRMFQKVMCRPSTGAHHLIGYNEYRSKAWLGPGYFELMPTSESQYPTDRGAYVVDYYRIPEGDVPAGWPRIRSNTAGLSRFVYGGTRDYLRRVSCHVSVGRPFKGEHPGEELDFSFVLCREEL